MNEGATFGAYRVVRKLGQGGMGAVYLAEHNLIGRRAAIKVLRRERTAQRDSVERFFNEARATSAVEDPGIVQVYDFGVTDSGTAYLVMEFLDGEPLSARLRRLGSLSAYDAVRITRQVAGSLAAAHATGIVHRDLKPENLFIVRDLEALGGERAKILDFGIAKLADERTDRRHTRTGAVIGTPAYMSPEQCNDSGKIDHRTDIYSLGCVLFHLLVGRPPFDLDGAGAIVAAHLREPAPVPSASAPDVPAAVDALVARCLAKQPGERFATMLELQQACDALLAQLPAEPPTVRERSPTARPDQPTTLASSVGESTRPVQPLRLRARVAIAAAAVAVGIVLAVATTRTSRSEPDVPMPVLAPAAAPQPQPAPVVTPLPPAVAPAPAPAPAAEPTPALRPAPAVPIKRPPAKKKPHASDVYEDRT